MESPEQRGGTSGPPKSCNDNSDDASIETALESLPGIDDVIVTGGTLDDAPVTVIFGGALDGHDAADHGR